jgi:ketosteroid isomerase-like protein
MIVLTACAAGGTADEADVRRAADEFGELVAAVDVAWNGKSIDAIRQVYTEDVVHDEQSSLNHFEGIDAIMAMATVLFPSLPGNQTTDSLYVGLDAGLAIPGRDGVLGVARATEAGPLEEVDLLRVAEGKVSSWTAFFSDERFSESGELPDLYAAARSSGDPQAVGGLYAANAVRVDSLFGDESDGRDAIVQAARDFAEKHPGARWDLAIAFGDVGIYQDPAPRGGIYQVTGPGPGDETCVVDVAVVFDHEVGQITEESVYYDAESLIACGWLT